MSVDTYTWKNFSQALKLIHQYMYTVAQPRGFRRQQAAAPLFVKLKNLVSTSCVLHREAILNVRHLASLDLQYVGIEKYVPS